jgi:hypothetical protein
VFDVARVLALAWALLRALQVPSRWTALLVVVAAYPLALQVAGGLHAAGTGTLDPAYGFLLLAIGPSFLPPGTPSAVLGRFPLAPLVLRWPAISDLVVALAMWVASRRLADRAAELPIARQAEALRWSRLSLAIVLLQVMELLAAIARIGASSLG